MKVLANVLAVTGILLVIYSVVGRFVGNQTISFGLITALPRAGLIMANSILLIAIIIRQWSK